MNPFGRKNNGHREAPEDTHRGADQNANAKLPVETTAEPEESPSVSEEIPDLVEPIVGWRCWDARENGYLVALNGGSAYGAPTWEPRMAKRATCNKRDSYAYAIGRQPEKLTHTHGPYEGCACGFYAAKLLSKAQWPEANYAYGRVAMWGKVIEHEGGFRAEYAYPIEIILVAKAGVRHYRGTHPSDRPAPPPTEIPAWTEEQIEGTRLRMETMYGIPVSVGSDDAMRDEWAAQYLDLPLPSQVVPLLEARAA